MFQISILYHPYLHRSLIFDEFSKIIGMELGTIISCVSIMEGDEPVIIASDKGRCTAPSMVIARSFSLPTNNCVFRIKQRILLAF